MNRFTIARMHRDPHTNIAVHRESYPEFFRDAGDATSTLQRLESGNDPSFFKPGRGNAFLEIQQHACNGRELVRTA